MLSKDIPDKLFYKIGEVARIVGVEPYVLRYWESEFNIKLSKSKNKQRLYQKKDIGTVEKIKDLLYGQRFTIEGAKKKLKEKRRGREEEGQLSLGLKDTTTQQRIKEIKQELEALLKIVK